MNDALPVPARPQEPTTRTNRRDLRLDLLRGGCVLLMLVGHLGWYRLTTHFAVGFVTAAEGFFFLSGATLGTVWSRYRSEGRERGLERRLLMRAAWLWVANSALILLAYRFEGSAAFPGDYFDRYWHSAPEWLRLVSLNQPSVLHILPRYSILLILSPLALRLFASRFAVLGALTSIGFWLAHFQDPEGMRFYLLEMRRRAAFPMASWQLIFFGGMALAVFAARHPGTGRRWRTRSIVAGLALVAGVEVFRRFGLEQLADPVRGWIEHQSDRATLGAVRLADFALAALVLWKAVDRWQASLIRIAGWVLLPLGQNALASFLLHIPALWVLNLVPWGADTTLWRLLTAAAVTVGIARLVTLPRVRKLLSPI